MKTIVTNPYNKNNCHTPPGYSKRTNRNCGNSALSQKGAFRGRFCRLVPLSLAVLLLGGVAEAHPAKRSARTDPQHQTAMAPAPEVVRAFYEGCADQRGEASWYGPGWHGRRTASGVPFNMMAMTAAHHWLPFGTRLKVTDQDTGREVIVVVTDRLRQRNRIIDLSMGAAKALGIVHQGTANVTLRKV